MGSLKQLRCRSDRPATIDSGTAELTMSMNGRFNSIAGCWHTQLQELGHVNASGTEVMTGRAELKSEGCSSENTASYALRLVRLTCSEFEVEEPAAVKSTG